MKKSMLALVLATATTFAFADGGTFTTWFNAIPTTTDTGAWAVDDPGEVYDVKVEEIDTVVVDTEYEAGATFTAETKLGQASKSEKISITATFSAAVPVAELADVEDDNKVGVTIANDGTGNYWYFVDGTTEGEEGSWVKGAAVTGTLPQSYDITIAIANDGTATYTVGGVNADTTGKTASKVNVVNVCGYGSFTQLKGETEAWGDIDVVIHDNIAIENIGTVTIAKVYNKDTLEEYTDKSGDTWSIPWGANVVVVYKAADETFVVRNGSFELPEVKQGDELAETDVQDGVTQMFAGGTGTSTNPYKIASYANLDELREDVADGTDYVDTYFQQTANITFASDVVWEGIGVSAKENKAASLMFKGIYDGNGKTISGVYFTKKDYMGVFQCIGDGAYIKNLIVSVSGFAASETSSYGCAAIVGYAYGGKVENVIAKSAATITGTHNMGGVVTRADIGIGDTLELKNCTNEMEVTTSYSKIGGMCAIVSGDNGTCIFDGCVNTATITGDGLNDKGNAGCDGLSGILGYKQGSSSLTIKNCQSVGSLNTANEDSDKNLACVASILGKLNKSCTTTFTGNIAKAGYLAIGSGTCSGLNFATVENDIATLIADTAVTKGGTYLVTALNAAPTVALAARNDTVTFDLSLVGDAFDDTNLTGAELAGYEFSKEDVNDELICAYVVADGYIELVFDVELASGAQTQSLALGSALPKPKTVGDEKAFEGWKIGESTEAVYALPTSSALVKTTVDAAASFVDAAPYTPQGQGGDTPIKVVKDSDWVKTNVKEGATTEEIQAAMEKTDTKGKTGWQNYVLGLNTDQSLKIDSAAPYADKLALVLNVNLPKVESGATVKYKLGEGAAADVVVIDPASLANGHHKVYAVVNGTNVETEREVGFMKVTAKTGTTIVAVPWESFTETAIEPTKLIDPSNRAADDELQIYGATTDTYDTYKIVNGEWSFVKSITSGGEGLEPSVTSVARGNAVILKTAAAEPAPVLLLGSYNAVAPAPVALVQPKEAGDVAWSIIANPDWQNGLNLNDHDAFKDDEVGNGNSILIPNNGAEPTRYIKDGGGWFYNEQQINGKRVKQVRKTDAIPAGTGFYFLNKSGKTSVQW